MPLTGPAIDIGGARTLTSTRRSTINPPRTSTTSTSTSTSSAPRRTSPAPRPAPTTSTPPAPAPTTATPADVSAAEQQAAALEAAIAAIESTYGLTKEQLLADESEIGQQYRLLTQQALRARENALGVVDEQAVGRGLFRSGIRLADRADVEALSAQDVALLAQQEASQRSDIQQQIAQASLQSEQQKAAAEEEYARAQLELQTLLASLQAGI